MFIKYGYQIINTDQIKIMIVEDKSIKIYMDMSVYMDMSGSDFILFSFEDEKTLNYFLECFTCSPSIVIMDFDKHLNQKR